jgi:hypothetical protein
MFINKSFNKSFISNYKCPKISRMTFDNNIYNFNNYNFQLTLIQKIVLLNILFSLIFNNNYISK